MFKVIPPQLQLKVRRLLLPLLPPPAVLLFCCPHLPKPVTGGWSIEPGYHAHAVILRVQLHSCRKVASVSLLPLKSLMSGLLSRVSVTSRGCCEDPWERGSGQHSTLSLQMAAAQRLLWRDLSFPALWGEERLPCLLALPSPPGSY